MTPISIPTETDPGVELKVAMASDAPRTRSLLERYLRELSAHREIPSGAREAADYPYLDAYWSEPGRHPFLILQGAEVVGFIFVRDPSSTGRDVHELSEFYVKAECRRNGIGHRAVLALWSQFPGRWELQVHTRNAGALQFWRVCTESIAEGSVEVRNVEADDGPRQQFEFQVGLG